MKRRDKESLTAQLFAQMLNVPGGEAINKLNAMGPTRFDDHVGDVAAIAIHMVDILDARLEIAKMQEKLNQEKTEE